MLDFVLKIAENAGKISLKHFRRIGKVSFKSKQDIVTVADTEVEEFLVNEIEHAFPEHGILAEETGSHKGNSDYLWVIDPVDGTVNYAAGLPYFAVSIGLAFKEQLILGVVFDPYQNDFMYAEKGKGAYINGRRIRIGSESKLINCLVATDLGHKRSRQIMGRLKSLLPVTRAVRIMGSASRGLVDTALDRFQAYVHNDIQPWDAAAAYVVIKEAGGDVINFEGKPWQLYDRTIIASNKIISKKLLKYTR